jgi:hypothetical protein
MTKQEELKYIRKAIRRLSGSYAPYNLTNGEVKVIIDLLCLSPHPARSIEDLNTPVRVASDPFYDEVAKDTRTPTGARA